MGGRPDIFGVPVGTTPATDLETGSTGMADDLLQEFLSESWENLTRLDTEIVELEKEPGDRALIASIFRTIHTIKGTCGFIGLNGLGSVAHAAENVLGRMRDGVLA